MIQQEDIGIPVGGKGHSHLVVRHEYRAYDGVPGETDALDAVPRAIPYAESVTAVVHMAEHDIASVRRPGRRKRRACNIGDLTHALARGADQPDIALLRPASLDKGQGGAEEISAAGQGLHNVRANAIRRGGHIRCGHVPVHAAEHRLAGKRLKQADFNRAPARRHRANMR